MKSVLVLLSLPAVVAFYEAASFQARNRNNGEIESSGVKREYLVHVPRSYDGTKAVPLVISMHGAGGWPAQQRDVSGWNALAEREGFIVVYPSAVQGAGPRIWFVQPGPSLLRDVRFISDLIDKLEREYKIDPHRIYANGLSNGGGMSFVLSCAMPDRIAAVGMVAAAQTLPSRWCTTTTPVPMIAFHGTADPVIPYNGGVTWISARSFPNYPKFIADWARRNGCGPNAVETDVAADVSRRTYRGCANDAAVELYTIRGGGHTWPGGMKLPEWFAGRTTYSISATEKMWEFFAVNAKQDSRPLRRSAGG